MAREVMMLTYANHGPFEAHRTLDCATDPASFVSGMADSRGSKSKQDRLESEQVERLALRCGCSGAISATVAMSKLPVVLYIR